MLIIHIDYNETVDAESIRKLTSAMHTIVSAATATENVPVYARKAPFQSYTAPIEIFVEIDSHTAKDSNALVADIKTRIQKWKKERAFQYPINLSLIPTDWKTEVGI